MQEYEERFEKLSEDQKLSRPCSEAGLRLVEVGHFFYALPSPRGKENRSLCQEYTLPRDQEGTRCAIWPCLGHESRQQTRIRIVNGIDKFVREAMPIQEGEEDSGKTAAKARPILKPSSTSGWDATFMKQRQWIDIEIQESKDPHCFQMSKFITRLLRHSEQVRLEGGVNTIPPIQQNPT